MIIDVAGRVECGTRPYNDDRILLDGKVLDNGNYSAQVMCPLIAAVCDGCGSYKGGDVAAQLVLGTMVSEMISINKNPESIALVLDECKRRLKEKKMSEPHYAEMCTTIAGCAFYDHGMSIFHAGDSRVYRYDGRNLAKMTMDHTVVQGMVSSGAIKPDELKDDILNNTITRCLGAECEPPEIHESRVSIQPGEIYMICSDGLWGSLEDEQIIKVLSRDTALSDLADDIVNMALESGSRDNISVILCRGQGERKVVESEEFILD